MQNNNLVNKSLTVKLLSKETSISLRSSLCTCVSLSCPRPGLPSPQEWARCKALSVAQPQLQCSQQRASQTYALDDRPAETEAPALDCALAPWSPRFSSPLGGLRGSACCGANAGTRGTLLLGDP